MLASIFMNVPFAGRCCTPFRVIAVYFAHMAMRLARPFNNKKAVAVENYSFMQLTQSPLSLVLAWYRNFQSALASSNC